MWTKYELVLNKNTYGWQDALIITYVGRLGKEKRIEDLRPIMDRFRPPSYRALKKNHCREMCFSGACWDCLQWKSVGEI